MAAGGKDLGDAGRVQAGRDHAERRPQPGAAGTEDDDVERMVDDVVTVGHLGLLAAEEELEDGKHAGTREDHNGCPDQQLAGKQPARVCT